MIRVCALKKNGKTAECWSYPNTRLEGAVSFARIGSQHGGVRTVSLCGTRIRVYRNGKKVAGAVSMAELRRRARRCHPR